MPSLLLTCFPLDLDAWSATSTLPVTLSRMKLAVSAAPPLQPNRLVPKTTQPSSTFSLPNPVTTLALQSTRLFAEPIVPVGGAPTAAENALLATALKAYASSHAPSVLEAYVASNRGSPWLVSILTNLGLIEFNNGYFSRSVSDWKEAWSLGKSATAPAAQAITNRAVAELLKIYCRVGRMEDIESLLTEIENRSFHGLPANMIRESKEALVDMKTLPKDSFKCGPFAVANILTYLKEQTPKTNAAIKGYATTSQGTSLAQVLALAGSVGLKMQAAKRVSGGELPLPAVVNWKLNHYGALLQAKGDRYLLVDPTFGTSEWILKDAVAQETSG